MQWQETLLRREDGCSFYCRTMGEGQPLLLIHGAAVDSEFFLETGAILAQHYRVIIYDRGGYGRSVEETEVQIDDCAEYFNRQGDDAAYVVRSLVPGEKALVIGCSCGAAVAGFFAARHPDMVERVLMHEPPIYALMEDDVESWGLINSVIEALDKGKYNRALNRFLLFLHSSSSSSEKEMTETEMDNFMINGMLFVRREFRHGFDQAMMIPPLSAETHPALMWGNAGVGTPLVECAHRVSKALDCPIYEIGGGHNAAREIPEDFARDVLPLLALR